MIVFTFFLTDYQQYFNTIEAERQKDFLGIDFELIEKISLTVAIGLE
jgi:hypothetical protein